MSGSPSSSNFAIFGENCSRVCCWQLQGSRFLGGCVQGGNTSDSSVMVITMSYSRAITNVVIRVATPLPQACNCEAFEPCTFHTTPRLNPQPQAPLTPPNLGSSTLLATNQSLSRARRHESQLLPPKNLTWKPGSNH